MPKPSRRTEPERRTYVYVIQANPELVKVGRATDPEARRRELSTGCPFRLELVYKHPCLIPARDIERVAHRLLDDSRTVGEWFAVPAKAAIEAVRQAESELMSALLLEKENDTMYQISVIAPEQSRAARALLGMTSLDVANKAGVGINTIQRFERGDQSMNLATLQKLVAAYTLLGIDFPDADTVRRVRRGDAQSGT